MVNQNDFFRAKQKCRFDSELSDRTRAPNGNRVARLDIAIFRRLITRRENIRKKNDLFIFKSVGNFQRSDIGEGNAPGSTAVIVTRRLLPTTTTLPSSPLGRIREGVPEIDVAVASTY